MLYVASGFALYFSTIFLIALAAYKNRPRKAKDDEASFMLANRSINYWLTALSAHASDMSDWLFMAFPAAIMTHGLFDSWIAIGLMTGMFASWTLIAPRLRQATEDYNCVTLSSYFEKRFDDGTGMLRVTSALLTLFFFTVYICAGLTGIGYVMENAFGISYATSVISASIFVALYTMLGGFLGIVWVDFFQALFLLSTLLIVPFFIYPKVGGLTGILQAASAQNISLSLVPDYSLTTILNIIFIVVSWGLGYFGTPHILTKFMAIDDVSQMHKSRRIGLAWQFCALSAAAVIGLLGISYFSGTLPNAELVFVKMVLGQFSPFFAGLILCAILGATISTVDAQIIVVASVFTQDFYRHVFKSPTRQQLQRAFRWCILGITAAACMLALPNLSSIQELVGYAWMGFGSSFGPVILFSLYTKKINRYGAFAGMLSGGIIAGLWTLFLSQYFIVAGLTIPALIPAFTISSIVLFVVSGMYKK